MKKLMKILAPALALCFVTAAFASCGKTGGKDEGVTVEANQTEDGAPSDETKASEPDYDAPDLVIEADDFAAMESFLNDWESQKWDGKVIRITGVSARRMSNCTIMEKNADGVGKGCSYEILGAAFPDDYPEDDAVVTLTGVLFFNPDTWARILQVPADQVVVK